MRIPNIEPMDYEPVSKLVGETPESCAYLFLLSIVKQPDNKKLLGMIIKHVGWCMVQSGDSDWKACLNAMKSGNLRYLQSIANTPPEIVEKLRNHRAPDVDLRPTQKTNTLENVNPFTFIPPKLTPEGRPVNFTFTDAQIETKCVKQIVCLANSRKLGGSCIAGREWKNGSIGDWIRIVHPTDECLKGKLSLYENGSEPKIGDIIEVNLVEQKPKFHQRENWIFNKNTRLKKINQINFSDLDKLLDNDAKLWTDCFRGLSNINRIRFAIAKDLSSSLEFIALSSLILDTEYTFKEKLKARFEYVGIEFELAVTDPIIEYRYLGLSQIELGPCFATISLGGEFKNYCYKLVAGIVKL